MNAFEALAKPETDMVIGRAEDGGYYLIGFNSEATRYIGNILFPNINYHVFKYQWYTGMNKAYVFQESN